MHIFLCKKKHYDMLIRTLRINAKIFFSSLYQLSCSRGFRFDFNLLQYAWGAYARNDVTCMCHELEHKVNIVYFGIRAHKLGHISDLAYEMIIC